MNYLSFLTGGKPKRRNKGASGLSAGQRARVVDERLARQMELARLERGAGMMPQWARKMQIEQLKKLLKII